MIPLEEKTMREREYPVSNGTGRGKGIPFEEVVIVIIAGVFNNRLGVLNSSLF